MTSCATVRFVVGAVSTAALLGGCAAPAWVKAPRAYEREQLSSPAMRWQEDGLAARHSERVRTSAEAARGATPGRAGAAGGR